VAKKFRISKELVSRLIQESKKQPEKQRCLKQREKDAIRDKRLVHKVAADMLKKSIPIDKAA